MLCYTCPENTKIQNQNCKCADCYLTTTKINFMKQNSNMIKLEKQRFAPFVETFCGSDMKNYSFTLRLLYAARRSAKRLLCMFLHLHS